MVKDSGIHSLGMLPQPKRSPLPLPPMWSICHPTACHPHDHGQNRLLEDLLPKPCFIQFRRWDGGEKFQTLWGSIWKSIHTGKWANCIREETKKTGQHNCLRYTSWPPQKKSDCRGGLQHHPSPLSHVARRTLSNTPMGCRPHIVFW